MRSGIKIRYLLCLLFPRALGSREGQERDAADRCLIISSRRKIYSQTQPAPFSEGVQVSDNLSDNLVQAKDFTHKTHTRHTQDTSAQQQPRPQEDLPVVAAAAGHALRAPPPGGAQREPH
jgi:hypothetical protein